jgi:nucleotide-binding universal stress UspA family protein
MVISGKEAKSARYSKILVAFDGSDESMKAAKHAIGLAKDYGAELVVMTAMRLPSMVGWRAVESPNSWQRKYTNERRKWFQEIKRLAKESGISVQTDIVESSMPPEGTITKYAQEHDVDVIMVGTRGSSGFAKQLLGSVAIGVTIYAHCTVIVVR